MRVVVALALALGCSSAPNTPSPLAPRTAPDASAPEPDPFPFPTGEFAVKRARRVTDHCGNMRWESDAVTIDPVSRTLYSTPDDRLYRVFFDGPDLVARGSFEPRDACPNDTYVELWRLEKESGDRMTGFVTTYSHFKPENCLHACKAVFAVELERAEEAD